MDMECTNNEPFLNVMIDDLIENDYIREYFKFLI